MQDLLSIFKELEKPLSGDSQSFTATRLEETPHRVGKDASGWPVLLLGAPASQNNLGIHLEHLDVQYSVRCRILNDSEVEEGIFTVIRCTNVDEELTEYFFRIIYPVLKTLGSTPTPSEVSQAITHLVELFRALSQPPLKSVSGLWAELFVIRNAKDPIAFLRAWHSVPEEKYDFNAGFQRIEVKSTSRGIRLHHFSLEQLTPPSGCQIVIASLFVESSGGGASLDILLKEIKDFLGNNPELEEKLDRVVAQTLGSTLRQSMDSRFDRQLAQDSFQVFDAQAIPKISGPVPAGVSDVHFVADLSHCEALPKKNLTEMGDIFASL